MRELLHRVTRWWHAEWDDEWYLDRFGVAIPRSALSLRNLDCGHRADRWATHRDGLTECHDCYRRRTDAPDV